jgi:hypothetical protein
VAMEALVWVKDARGRLHVYHEGCAQRRGITANTEPGTPYHTQVCSGCARYWDAPGLVELVSDSGARWIPTDLAEYEEGSPDTH